MKLFSVILYYRGMRWATRRGNLAGAGAKRMLQGEQRFVIMASDKLSARLRAIAWLTAALDTPTAAAIQFGAGRCDALPATIEIDESRGGIRVMEEEFGDLVVTS